MNWDVPPATRSSVRNLPGSLRPQQEVETPPPAAIQGSLGGRARPSFFCLSFPLLLSAALSCRHTLSRWHPASKRNRNSGCSPASGPGLAPFLLEGPPSSSSSSSRAHLRNPSPSSLLAASGGGCAPSVTSEPRPLSLKAWSPSFLQYGYSSSLLDFPVDRGPVFESLCHRARKTPSGSISD